MLIAKNAAVNHANNDGWTALMAASKKGHSSIVQILIDNNADVNHVSYNGIGALAAAVKFAPLNKSIVKTVATLLRYGADPFADGHSAAQQFLLRMRSVHELDKELEHAKQVLMETFRCFAAYRPDFLTWKDANSKATLDYVVRSRMPNLARVCLLLSRETIDASSAFAFNVDRDTRRVLNEYQANRHLFQIKWSALVPLSLGLVSLDLPVLCILEIEEWLVACNDERVGSFAPVL